MGNDFKEGFSMRLHTSLFACSFAVGLLAGCCTYVPPPVVATQPPSQSNASRKTSKGTPYL